MLSQSDLDKFIAQLAVLDDTALQRLNERLFPKNEAARLQQLHAKQSIGRLNEAEADELAGLVKEATQFFRFWLISRNEALRQGLEQRQNKG